MKKRKCGCDDQNSGRCVCDKCQRITGKEIDGQYKELKLTYLPFKCAIVNVPHWDLHYTGPKGEVFNLACIACSDSKNEGIKLLREMLKAYKEVRIIKSYMKHTKGKKVKFRAVRYDE